MWSNNNRACTTTWLTLIGLKQLSKRQIFKTAGDKPMSALLFFAQDASGDILAVRANALASQLDGVFVTVRGAMYEKGIKEAEAVSSMAAVLMDRENTVAELAEEADRLYRFYREEG